MSGGRAHARPPPPSEELLAELREHRGDRGQDQEITPPRHRLRRLAERHLQRGDAEERDRQTERPAVAAAATPLGHLRVLDREAVRIPADALMLTLQKTVRFYQCRLDALLVVQQDGVRDGEVRTDSDRTRELLIALPALDRNRQERALVKGR